MSFRIRKVCAREILDSRGNPTVECDVVLGGGTIGRAAVPSGASTGKHEAHELRDGGRRFHGLGVKSAVSNINTIISKKIAGMDSREQQEVDDFLIKLDGSSNKALLGANAILAVSLAASRAAAIKTGMPLYRYISESVIGAKRHSKYVLPVPFCNIINGGKHAGSSLKLQEFMIVPSGFKTFVEGITAVSEVYHQLKSILKERYGAQAVNVGDEGGFAPQLEAAEEALALLEAAVDTTGYSGKINFAIDAASSEFYSGKERKYEISPRKFITPGELADYYLKLAKEFPVVSIEDPFEQESFREFAWLTKRLSPLDIQVVGDDLTVTNVHRIRHAAEFGSCSCLLLKVNQIGTLSESIAAAQFAFSNKWNVMVSHRSGETDDAFISDLAVALGCGQLKAGAPARSERTAKYNRLIRIEEELSSSSYGW